MSQDPPRSSPVLFLLGIIFGMAISVVIFAVALIGVA
jgi:hypothetical protein